MLDYKSIIIMFILMYCVSLVTRALITKEKEKKPFIEGLKTKSNQKTAFLIALVVTVCSQIIKL